MVTKIKFKFKPVSNSWVALHPQPKEIVQFIGGAFFGTFPTIFFSYFLNQLFNAGYTIIALPFRFTFNHWSVAISLVKEQYIIRREIVKEARNLSYNHSVYLKDTNFFWIGQWFIEYLATKSNQSNNKSLLTPPEQLEGKHLEPLGVKIGNYIVSLNSFDKFINSIKSRRLETVAIQLLEEIKQKQKEIDLKKKISKGYHSANNVAISNEI